MAATALQSPQLERVRPVRVIEKQEDLPSHDKSFLGFLEEEGIRVYDEIDDYMISSAKQATALAKRRMRWLTGFLFALAVTSSVPAILSAKATKVSWGLAGLFAFMGLFAFFRRNVDCRWRRKGVENEDVPYLPREVQDFVRQNMETLGFSIVRLIAFYPFGRLLHADPMLMVIAGDAEHIIAVWDDPGKNPSLK